MRRAEAPFRRSGGLTIRPDVAGRKLQHCRCGAKGLRYQLAIASRPARPAPALAGGRQLRQRHRRLWLRRHLRRLGMQHRVAEPVGESPARSRRRRRLRLAFAFAAAGRAFDADVEVIVVAVHRPHLVQPGAVAVGLAAQRLLDRGIDEDALRRSAPARRRGSRRDASASRSADRCRAGRCAPSSTADISSRSLRDNRRFGIGVSQMSASSPTWWLAWPVSIGPPRGCDMSPTRRPGQPASLRALAASRSTSATRSGWPQLRLRDSRITCQVSPLIGSASAPARQPLA